MDISLSREINLSPKGKVSSLLKHTAPLSFLVLLLPRNIQQQTIWFSKVIEYQAFTFVFQWLLSLPFLYWVPSHWLPINTNTEPQTCRHAWNTTHTSQALPGAGLGSKSRLMQYNYYSIQNHESPLYLKQSQAYFPFVSFSSVQELVLLFWDFSFIFLPQTEANTCMYSLNSPIFFFFWENHSLPHMGPDNETTKQDNSLHDTEMLLMLNQAQNSKRASN